MSRQDPQQSPTPETALEDALRRRADELSIPLLGWTPLERYTRRFPEAALSRSLPGVRSLVVFATPMLGGVVETLALGRPPFIDSWWRGLTPGRALPLLRTPAYLLKQLVKGATSAYNQRYHLQEHLDALTDENNRRAYELARLLEARGHRSLPVDPCKRHYFPLTGLWSLKHAAEDAGLGTLGRHRMLITPQFGTRVWLGGLLTTAELAPVPVQRRPSPCARCALCLEACPMARKSGGFSFPTHRCTLCSTCLQACPAP